MEKQPRRVRARSLLSHLLTLSAAVALPLMLLVGVLTWKWIDSEQARIRGSINDIAENSADQIDRYIIGQIAMLQALATSPAIDAGDFKSMDSQMRELARIYDTNIVLRAPDGSRFVDTRYQQGEPLPKIPLTEGERGILTSKEVFVSDLFTTAKGSNTPVVRVSVPVIRDGEARYLIAARLPRAKLSTILRKSGIEPPYWGAVTDRRGEIIADADGLERAVGRPWLDEADRRKRADARTDQGSFEVQTSHSRSQLSGWTVVVAIDPAILNAPLYKSIWIMGLLALGMVALIALASGRIARGIIGAQRQIEAAASAVRLGETISPPLTPIRETNLIGQALAEASARMRDQAQALVAANRELEARVESRTRELSAQAELTQLTLDSMAQGLLMIDADGRVAICNRRALDLLDLPPALMARQPLLSEVLRHQFDRGGFEHADETLGRWTELSGLKSQEHAYERELPNGIVLEIRTRRRDGGGAVRTFTDITERKKAERRSVYLARHDPLTALPNRTLLMERLEREAGQPDGRGFALLIIDLDHFKAVNDRHGHPTGDALLRLVTERIQSLVDLRDVVARLGGDEFAVLQLADAQDAQPAAACRLAEKIVAAIEQPFHPNGRDVRIGTSIGIATAQDGAGVNGIMKNADLALYRAKSEGRSGYRCYEAAMDAAAEERYALELDLRQALHLGEFELYYQPVVNLANGSVTAFEALIRWNHPARGLIMPGEFVPIAEDVRLIVPIGKWALRQACGEAATWPAHTRVLVNISAMQIEDPAFVASVLAAIATTGLAPNRLQLEITETVLVRESDSVLQALHALRAFGVRIALDDFGTGHSSLNYLRRFPLDSVKIDRSFVNDFEDRRSAAIMSSITSLGHEFGMSITAEGVETRAQLDFVRSIGCTEGQGYLFGRPAPALKAARVARRFGEPRLVRSDVA